MSFEDLKEEELQFSKTNSNVGVFEYSKVQIERTCTWLLLQDRHTDIAIKPKLPNRRKASAHQHLAVNCGEQLHRGLLEKGNSRAARGRPGIYWK